MKFAALLLTGVVAIALLVPLPRPASLPPGGVQILDRHGHVLYQVIDPVRGAARPVPLGEIAPALQQATIAVEDASFESNPGVDPVAIGRALVQDVRGGRVVSGASTITQQLARLRYEAPPEPLVRKIWEGWLAVRLTGSIGKGTILEQYLNSAPHGNLAIGAEAAAWTYFSKPARELSLGEAALLAGLPQAPTDYDPIAQLDAARTRQRQVLQLMQRHAMITEQQAASAAAEPLQLNDRPFPLSAAHFVDYIRSFGAAGSDRIQTTLDRDIQALAERAVERQLTRLAGHDASDAAVVVFDPRSGEVLAMVGGRDYFAAGQSGAQINMAVTPRQPGSAFKPITYAAALESGQFSEASIVDDQRTVFRTRRGEAYGPENYDHEFHGPVPLRVALASSLNVPAVQVEARTGLERVLDLAQKLNLDLGDPDRYDLSLTLGGAEVRLLDLSAAYGAFATGGVYHPPVVIAGENSTPRRIISEQTAWLIDDMLSDDSARGPGFGRGGILNVPGRSVAVKTGTTSDFRDNWTIGFTPNIVVGVWVGNADNRPMHDVSGVSGAAPLWRDILDQLLDGRPPTGFERPPDLAQVPLCSTSESSAGPTCPFQRLEWLRLSDLPSGDARPDHQLRIVTPDPDTVIVLDTGLPPEAQRLPIEVEASGPVTVVVDGAPIGSRDGPGVLAWPPAAGHHVLQAAGGGAFSEPVEIEVVPSGSEQLP